MTETMSGDTTSSEPPGRVGAPDQVDNSARNRMVIGLLLVATFVVFLNETIIGVAIPPIMADLGLEASTGQWLSTAFMLTMAVVIPVTGFLLQRFNTRPIFILAMSLFGVGTLTAALAPGFTVLLVGRIVQASGTAIMLPLLMTTVMQLVPARSRGKVMGNISIVISVAPAIGPTVSGYILNYLDWRWIFWIMLPLALAALALGATLVKNVTEPRRISVDSASVALSAFGFGGLVYGLSNLGEAAKGADVPPPWIALTIGIASLIAFVLRQRTLQRDDRALLDLRTFENRGFSVPVILMAVMMAALFGTVILLPLYMQNVLHFEPLLVGLVLLPGGLLMGLLGPVVGRLYDRVGPRPLIIPGAFVVASAMWGMTFFTETTPFTSILLANVTMSAGLAFMFTPLFTSSLGSLKPALYSHGSATLATLQQLAGAAGTALFIAFYTAQSVALKTSGVATDAALAGGVRAAFTCGAILATAALATTFFVPKPAEFLTESENKEGVTTR